MLTTAFSQWNEDDAFQLSAALAFYTFFSLAPLLIVMIAIAGIGLGQEAAQNQIIGVLQGLVGWESAVAIQAMVQEASALGSSILATLIGLATLFLGAGVVVGQLQTSLNTIWKVAAKPWGGFLSLLRARFVSFALVLGLGFLLLVSLVLSAALAALSQMVISVLPGSTVVWQVVDVVLSVGFITVLFALIYKMLPDAQLAWRDVWIGAAITSLLFTMGKFAIGLYLGQGSVISVYGAAGSLAVILLWVYYSSLIFFFGAEFTQVYARTYGTSVVPAENARLVTAAESPPKKEDAEREIMSGRTASG
ncbi:MAG: YihY/virulence factor BrkB family protein [Candidatus Binatia bacterium]